MLIIHFSGRKVTRSDWPEAGTLEGLLQAIHQWDLDTGMDYSNDQAFDPDPLSAPFRSGASSVAFEYFSPLLGKTRYVRGAPMYPDAPKAVRYFGNFKDYAFGFSLSTDDQAVIDRLDAAIKANLERQGYSPLDGGPAKVETAALQDELRRLVEGSPEEFPDLAAARRARRIESVANAGAVGDMQMERERCRG